MPGYCLLQWKETEEEVKHKHLHHTRAHAYTHTHTNMCICNLNMHTQAHANMLHKWIESANFCTQSHICMNYHPHSFGYLYMSFVQHAAHSKSNSLMLNPNSNCNHDRQARPELIWLALCVKKQSPYSFQWYYCAQQIEPFIWIKYKQAHIPGVLLHNSARSLILQFTWESNRNVLLPLNSWICHSNQTSR